MYETKKYNAHYYLVQDESRMNSARAVLGEFFKIYKPTSVVDFGCGLGHWLCVAQDMGVAEVLGLDGNAVADKLFKIDHSKYQRANFEQPVTLAKRYELAMTIEVAEHLPEAAAVTFVKTLTAASDVILFSAAAPYQGGCNHFNEQPTVYWAEIFARQGYVCFDILREKIWENPKANPAHCQNIMVYVCKERAKIFEDLGYRHTTRPQLKYHPRFVARKLKKRAEMMAWRRRVWKSFLRLFGVK